MTYTYTIFDGDPGSSGGEWPSHEEVEIDAESDEEAVSKVRDVLEIEACGLSTSDGYAVGDVLYAIVWNSDEVIVGEPRHKLTESDLDQVQKA